MKSYYIETCGCQMNELDSEKVAGLLSHRGMQPTTLLHEADVVLFNTCSVREKAVQKILSRLGRLKKLKQEKPSLIVAVLGCVAQHEGEALIKRAPVVDIVTGPQKIYRIPTLIDRVRAEGGPVVEVDVERGPMPVEIDTVLRENSFRAKVTIQEGCDKFCTFCIVPFTRGREKNRPSQLVVDEIRRLAADGFVEILLLGQNVNSYVDPSPRGWSFAQLLEAVGRIDGIRRVRFTSPHPADFNPEVIRVMNEVPAICNQIHMPLQSGSPDVLLRMKRGYTRDEFLSKVEMTRIGPRRLAISTDFIVGFPGEREVDFEATLELMGQVRFNQAFTFMYSPRPYTAAIRLEDDVPDEEKKRRLAVLQGYQERIQLELNNEYIGSVVEVLVEGPSKTREQLMGRTTENVCVNLDGPLDWIGKTVDIRIEQVHAYSLKGSVAQTGGLRNAIGS